MTRPPTTTYAQIMGEFLPEERTLDELACLTMQIILQEDRENLNASNKGKVYFSFIKGIPNASILPTLSKMECSTYYNLRQGSTFNQENLVWPYEAIQNSCNRDLQNILNTKMLRYPNHERFGPINFYELVNQMTSVNLKAVRAITQELTSLKVTNSDGQSISKTVKLIRSTLGWLAMANMTTPDIFTIIYNILETCTVPDFLLFLKTLTTNAMLNKHKLEVEDLFLQAEDHYCSLIIATRWNATSHQASSFQVQRAMRQGTTSWLRTAPGTGEPHQKTVNDKVYKWCGTCKKWFFGNSAHLTEEHFREYSNNNQITSSTTVSNVAATTDHHSIDNSTLRRSYFTEGL
jgi:hypothetical protein